MRLGNSLEMEESRRNLPFGVESEEEKREFCLGKLRGLPPEGKWLWVWCSEGNSGLGVHSTEHVSPKPVPGSKFTAELANRPQVASVQFPLKIQPLAPPACRHLGTCCFWWEWLAPISEVQEVTVNPPPPSQTYAQTISNTGPEALRSKILWPDSVQTSRALSARSQKMW